MSEPLFFRFRSGERSLDWEFIDPDTGFKIKANSRAELVKYILQYRANNGLDQIENLELSLEDYLCRLPQNTGKCRPDVALKRGLAAYWKGGIMLLKSLLYKSFASQKEADLRSEVCVACPHNIFPNKNHYVRWADALAEGATRGKKSSNHTKLGNCDVCSCCMRAKVWIGKDILEVSDEELVKFPDHCWQKKEALSKKNK